MESSEKASAFDSWGIVEVMGHKRYAGHITEQQIAGAALIRVDVPQVVYEHERFTYDGRGYGNGSVKEERTVAAFSKLIGVGSVYCITPTTEEIARRCAVEIAKCGSDPLPVSLPVNRQLPASTGNEDVEDAEFDERFGDTDDELDELGDNALEQQIEDEDAALREMHS